MKAVYRVVNLVTHVGVYEIAANGLHFFPRRGDEGSVLLEGDALDELPADEEILAIMYEIALPKKYLTFAHEFSEPVKIVVDEDGTAARMVCMDRNLVGWYPAAEIFEDKSLKGEVTQFEA